MSMAKFRVSFELFRELLHLPDSAEVYGVEPVDKGSFYVYVKSPDLPEIEVKDGIWAIPEISPVFEQTVDIARFNNNVTVRLKDWGFPKL